MSATTLPDRERSSAGTPPATAPRRRGDPQANTPAPPPADAGPAGEVPVLVRLPDLGSLLERLPRRESDPVPTPAPTPKPSPKPTPAAAAPLASPETSDPVAAPKQDPVDLLPRRERRPRPDPQPSTASSLFNKVLGAGLIVGLIATAYLLLSGKNEPNTTELDAPWPQANTEAPAKPSENKPETTTPAVPDGSQTAITEPPTPATPMTPADTQPANDPPDAEIAREIQVQPDTTPETTEIPRFNDPVAPVITETPTTQPFQYPDTKFPPYPFESALPKVTNESADDGPALRTGRLESPRYGGDGGFVNEAANPGAARLQGTIETPQVKPRYEQSGSGLY